VSWTMVRPVVRLLLFSFFSFKDIIILN
jgi:hypothetical protein